MNHYSLPRIFPRIHHLNSRANKISGVAGDDHQAAADGGRRHQTIHIWQPLLRTQTSPNFTFIKADLKNSPLENRNDLHERSFEHSGLYWIFTPDLLHTSADFPHRQDTQVVGFCRVVKKPTTDCWICSRALGYFTNHVGIDEIHEAYVQSPNKSWSARGGLAFRGSFRSKSQSSSSLVSPVPKISIKLRILVSFAFFSSCPSASCKIRRCSSSAETPCSAARCFNLFASSSEMFLTSN